MTFTLGPTAGAAGYGLAAFDQIGSTNAEAMSRARGGERGPMWFVTTTVGTATGLMYLLLYVKHIVRAKPPNKSLERTREG